MMVVVIPAAAAAAANTTFIDIWIVGKPLIMMVSTRFFYALKIDLNWDMQKRIIYT
jgi:hypothetical protein